MVFGGVGREVTEFDVILWRSSKDALADGGEE